MSRARLLLSESWQSIRLNLSTTIAATMTVLIGMCLLGLFIALGTWVLSWSGHLQDQLQVRVFFCTSYVPPEGCTVGATDKQEKAVGVALRSMPGVEKVVYVSKEEAFAMVKKQNPDLFIGDIVTYNPEPDAWKITPADAKLTPVLGKKICAAHYPGVQPCPPAGSKDFGDKGGVHWGSAVTKRVLTIGKVISLVFLIAVILLVIASTMLIANTIRLSIFSRRREIEVMKLVGATNWFIRGPFMLEGLLTGLAGSLLAVLVLLLGKTLVWPSIESYFSGTNSDGVHAVPFTLNALALVVAGLLLGAAGSGLTIRRFLQV